MRRKNSPAFYLFLFLLGSVCVITSGTARGQESAAEVLTPARAFAEKIDEYGRIGHCDMTARLDNLAVAVQNNPGAKVFVISFDPREKKYDYAGWNLKLARHYIVNVRGVDPARVVTVRGGSRDVKEGVTELWLVPEGAIPPADPPAADKYTAQDFSGLFDSYATDEQIYKLVVELGYSGEDISQTEFAAKLKRQPDSQGYIVIRTSKNSPPGAWRRIARRDEQVLRKDHGVEPQRLSSINGGPSGEDYTTVELWVLPKSAPPPAGVTEESERKSEAAYRLNTLDSYSGDEKDAENWMLENLAETLRDDPQATAFLVAREPAVYEEPETEGEAEAADEHVQADAQAQAADLAGGETSGEDAESEEASASEEEDETDGSMLALAEGWKNILTTKHGIPAHRVVVRQGRRMQWSNGRLVTWVVPEKAQPPDPNARDKDEPEEDESVRGAPAGGGDAGGVTVETVPPRAR